MKTKVFFMHMRTGLCLMAGVVAMCSLKAETQQSDCDVYKNIRMNVYLRKMVDGRVDMCTMHISFLDLDDDNREFFVIETVIPSSDVLDGSILDYIMEDQFLDEDIMEPGNLEIVLILNATMSFHRSRRIEKKEQQGLIEFL